MTKRNHSQLGDWLKAFVAQGLTLLLASSVGLAQPADTYPVTNADGGSAAESSPWGGSAVTDPNGQDAYQPFAPPKWSADQSVLAPIYDPAIRLAEAPSLPSHEPFTAPPQQRSGRPGGMPPGARAGFFQKLNFAGSWIPRIENDSIGMSSLGGDVVFGVPFPNPQSPLLITPGYRTIFLDGPDFTDVPARVHEASLDLTHFRKLNDRWMLNLAVTMGLYADEDSFGSGDAFRVTGRALGIRQMNDRWKWILGVVYLNRAGYSVIPATGLMYDRGDFKADLIFPRPKLSWRLPSSGTPADEEWIYLLGELGGNIWAVQRASGADDELSYSDIRVIIGYKSKPTGATPGGLTRRWEAGYVFNREIEYDSEGFDSALDDSAFLRFSLSY